MSEAASDSDQERFVFDPSDYELGYKGTVLDVDGDGETTATVQQGVWRSDDQELADVLNARHAARPELQTATDDDLVQDAREFLGAED
jgi:hypothetical protein